MENRIILEELKQLSGNVYETGEYNTPASWEILQKECNPKTGFQAIVYQKDNYIAVVYRGTEINKKKENLKDIKSDIQMGLGLIPAQYHDADKLYKEIQHKYPHMKIIVSGHSLGGSLSQLVSAKNGCLAVTYNAYGTGKILTNMGIYDQRNLNIINYGNPNDNIFGMNYINQPGRTFITETSLEKDTQYYARKELSRRIFPNISAHNLDKLNLEEAVETTPANFKNTQSSNTVLKASISYNHFFTPEEIGRMSTDEFLQNESVIMKQLENGQIRNCAPRIDYNGFKNPQTDSNRIFTREDVEKMSSDEYLANEDEIMAQIKTIGIPFKRDLPEHIPTYEKQKSYNVTPENGRWVTINGNHVFIED